VLRRQGAVVFIDEKAKVNAKYYEESLLPSLVADCSARNASRWLHLSARHTCTHRTIDAGLDCRQCPEFTSKDRWPPNSPDLNPLDYHVWGAMLDLYQKYQPRPMNISELKVVLQSIWNDLPQDPIDRSILSFTTRLRACIKANGGHFKYLM